MAKKKIFQELSALFGENRNSIIDLWQNQIKSDAGNVIATLGEEEINKMSLQLFDKIIESTLSGFDLEDPAYIPVTDQLKEISREFTRLNLSPSETATYVFSLKDALLETLQAQFSQKERLNEAVMVTNRLVDRIGLVTFEAYTEVKAALIRDQQRSLIETAAPVVKVWDRILMVPLIGILDSERTQLVMDKVLSRIEETQARIVILDITGIPAVDTLVARHLISTATAVKLMGARCIVTGISARIAQTVIQMGVDLAGLKTKASMAEGLKEAFGLLNLVVSSDKEVI